MINTNWLKRIIRPKIQKGHLNAQQFLGYSYMAFAGLPFIVNVKSAVFNILIIPSLIYFVYCYGQYKIKKHISHNIDTALFFILIFLCALSIVFNKPIDTSNIANIIKVILFVFGLCLALHTNNALAYRLGTILIIMGATNAAISIALDFFFLQHARLTGFELTKHPIIGSLVINICYAFALHRVVFGKSWRIFYTVCLLVLLMFIIMTGSRGPYLVTFINTAIILIAAFRQHKKESRLFILSFGIIFAAILLACLAAFNSDFLASLLQRGTSNRFPIWEHTFHMIIHSPWFGYGPDAPLQLGHFKHPHNIYLSTAFYYGIPAALALISLLAHLWHRAIKLLIQKQGSLPPLLISLLVIPTVGGLTDLSAIMTKPSVMWLILWLPLTWVSVIERQAH